MSEVRRADPQASVSNDGWWRGVVASAQLAVSRPWAWPLALLGFLVRGGLLLFIVPFVVLPTPTGLATIFGPDIISIAISTPNPGLVRLIAIAAVLAGGWLIVASAIGAWTDVILIRWAAAGLRGPTGPDRGAADALPGDGMGPAGSAVRPALLVRVALVRLACQVPLFVAAAWAGARAVGAVYAQYVSPGDLATSLPVRVVESMPDAIVIVLVAWLFGEVMGGLAARRLVLDGSSLARALVGGIASLVLRPMTSAATAGVTLAVSVAIVAPPLLLAAFVWSMVRVGLLGDATPPAIVAGALAFSATWLGGLALAALVGAWRSAAWTAQALRRRPAGVRILRRAVVEATPTGS